MSNDAAIPVDAPGEYAAGLLTRLAGRNPLEILGGTGNAARSVFSDLSDAAMRRPEASGKWSMLEVMHHLADGEMVLGVRIRMILAQDRPPITAYDQEAWAEKLRYRDADLGAVQLQFQTLRDANLRVARELSPEDLGRAGIHTERGAESVGYILRLLAGHDLTHLAQLERIRRTVS